jgi:cell division protein ZapA (FtsZ GTPase activity inhibitor)
MNNIKDSSTEDRSVSTEQPVNKDDTVELEISALDNSFRITCPKNRVETMRVAEKHLIEKLEDLKKIAPNFSNEKLAILAAFDICHDLVNLQLKKASFEDIVKLRLNELEGIIDKAYEDS